MPLIAISEMFRARAIPGRRSTPAERRARAAQAAARQVVSPEELVRALNRELARRGDCAGLEVAAGPQRAAEPDLYGCNWNTAQLRLRLAHGASTRALAGVREVVEWARLNFALAEARN
jgi:DNA-binding transcriptional regulator YdaS (Cro superfamily)